MRSLKRKSPKVQPPSKTPTFNSKNPKSKENSAFFEAQKVQRKEEKKDDKVQKMEEKKEEETVQTMKEEKKDDKEMDA